MKNQDQKKEKRQKGQPKSGNHRPGKNDEQRKDGKEPMKGMNKDDENVRINIDDNPDDTKKKVPRME